MDKRAFCFCIMVSTCLLLGCATIVSKSRYPIALNSEPSKATVTITNHRGNIVFRGNTPTVVPLKSGSGFFTKAKYLATFEMEGYEKRVITIYSKLDGWYFGNLLFGGLIGLIIVDPATGAMFKLDRKYLYERMTPLISQVHKGNLPIIMIDEIPVALHEHMEPFE